MSNGYIFFIIIIFILNTKHIITPSLLTIDMTGLIIHRNQSEHHHTRSLPIFLHEWYGSELFYVLAVLTNEHPYIYRLMCFTWVLLSAHMLLKPCNRYWDHSVVTWHSSEISFNSSYLILHVATNNYQWTNRVMFSNSEPTLSLNVMKHD